MKIVKVSIFSRPVIRITRRSSIATNNVVRGDPLH